MFKELYYALLKHLGQQASLRRVKLRIKAPVYHLDSTVVSLCLSVFYWATFRTKKGVVKMDTLLDYDGKLPVYVNITQESVADNKGENDILLEKGSVIVADQYYNDFPMLNVWDSRGVYFVIRHKENLKYSTIKEKDLPETTAKQILKDEEIELNLPQSKMKYPGQLRRGAVWDEENKQTIELITNNFNWAAQTIADLYKSLWEIEIFFRDLPYLLFTKK